MQQIYTSQAKNNNNNNNKWKVCRPEFDTFFVVIVWCWSCSWCCDAIYTHTHTRLLLWMSCHDSWHIVEAENFFFLCVYLNVYIYTLLCLCEWMEGVKEGGHLKRTFSGSIHRKKKLGLNRLVKLSRNLSIFLFFSS